MTPERFAQVKQLFLEVCGRAPTERAAFLAARCAADMELRAEVEALLAVHSQTETTRAAEPDVTRTVDSRPPPTPAAAAPLPTERSLPSGTVVAGRFRIVDRLGRGGMGEVYRADDLRLGQTVALKFLPVEFAANAAWRRRLLEEVRLARTITHPHVCRVYDLNEAAGECFISMEYVDGENLKTLLQRIGRLPGDRAAELAQQLCAGLAAAHARGVLHRDLKPANVMLDGQGHIRIMDFGLAAPPGQVRGAEIRVGTPAYMAPEQLAGAGVSTRSDLYALGLVLYELFTGRPALDAAAPPPTVRSSARPSAPSQVVPDINPAVERAILRCLEPNPADRPASVLELAAALPGGDALRLAQELGQTPTPSLVAATQQRPVNRRSAGFALAALAVLLAAAVFVGSRTHPLCRAGAIKPPAVLAEKAREHLAAAGLTCQACEAYGITGALPSAAPGAAVPAPRLAADPREILFWYRCRSTPLVPLTAARRVFGGGRTTLEDPPPGAPGEVSMVLDTRGQLRAARVTPHPGRAADPDPDWNPWHRSAGLAPGSLAPDPGDAGLPIAADRCWAWRTVGATESLGRVRVEAAAWRGQPVWYAVQPVVPNVAAATEVADVARRETASTVVSSLLLTVLFLVALPLTRLNLRRGRSDPRGAFRLGAFVFLAAGFVSLLQATHTTSPLDELELVVLALTGAVGQAVVVWLFYLALEPFARREGPHLLVAWARVLAGRLRDAVVGRDLLLGTLLGVAGGLLYQLEDMASTMLGLTARPRLLVADFFAAGLSLREALATIVDALRFGVYTALWLTLLIVLLRQVLRRTLVAGVAAALLVAVCLVPQGSHPLTALLFFGIGIGGGLAWTALRWGLVPVAVMITTMIIMLRLPLTFDLQQWYIEDTVLALASIAALALFGFCHTWRGSATVSTTT